MAFLLLGIVERKNKFDEKIFEFFNIYRNLKFYKIRKMKLKCYAYF